LGELGRRDEVGWLFQGWGRSFEPVEMKTSTWYTSRSSLKHPFDRRGWFTIC